MDDQDLQFDLKLRGITPALDFHPDKSYVTVTIQEVRDGAVKDVPYVVTSDKKRIELQKDALFQNDLFVTRPMILPSRPRWRRESIRDYLRGEEVGDLRKSVEYVREQLDYYVDFGDTRWSLVVACWIVGTYFHRLFESFPYIHLNGNMESGKTKALRLVSLLAFNGITTVGSTPAYLIRMIHGNHATLCIDEVESLRSGRDENSRALIGMLNTGYKKDLYVGKCEQPTANKVWTTQDFEAYSPKMFAGISGLEPSLASRCIAITMVRSANATITRRDYSITDEAILGIRDHLYLTLLGYWPAITGLKDGIHESELIGRGWELWKPILVIAKAADLDGAWYEELHNFALESMQQQKQAALQDFLPPKLLRSLLGLFGSEGSSIEASAEKITSHLISSDSESFGWLRDSKRAGRWVGDELRKLRVVTGPGEPTKVDGKTVRIYSLDRRGIENCLRAYQ